MAIDSDSSISVPSPPPPRPTARHEAIAAAMRKFDGTEEVPAARSAPSWWSSHQRQLGALATAAIIAVVSIPVALTVLKDQPRPSAPPPKATTHLQPKFEPPPAASGEARDGQAGEMPAVEVPRSKLPLEPHETASPAQPSVEQKAVGNIAPDLPIAAAPTAAPPPPPPPAPAPERENSADEAEAASVVVSGSRIRQEEPRSSQHGLSAAKRAADSTNADSPLVAYGKFLPRLQNAVRSGDRRAVIALIQYPLRVNYSGGPQSYPDRVSVEKDFDRIFTANVRSAILAQRADNMFVRDQGAMIGDGQVWFDQVCRNSDCSQVGPVRIKAINP